MVRNVAPGCDSKLRFRTVRARGFEPPRSFEHMVLNHACLPFHHARAVRLIVSMTAPIMAGSRKPRAARLGFRILSGQPGRGSTPPSPTRLRPSLILSRDLLEGIQDAR